MKDVMVIYVTVTQSCNTENDVKGSETDNII